MSKNKKEDELIKFKSDYKNLAIVGTGIIFKDGIYETDDVKEIEILRNSNLVLEAGE